ncbi:hypothetical protein Chor_012988 [Crotalus horridus]
MKTLLTIEIKDSRTQPLRGHLAGPPGNQRAELTLGLRNSPLRITSSSHGSSSSSFAKPKLFRASRGGQSGPSLLHNICKGPCKGTDPLQGKAVFLLLDEPSSPFPHPLGQPGPLAPVQPSVLVCHGNATQDGGLLCDQNSWPVTSRLSPPSCLLDQARQPRRRASTFSRDTGPAPQGSFAATPERLFLFAPRLVTMPGVPTPDLEGRQEPSATGPEEPASQEAGQNKETYRQILEQRVAEAKKVVGMLVSAIGNLRQEAAALRAEQQHLRQHMEKLRQFLKQEKEASTKLQAPEDPCAKVEGTETAQEPVAQPPISSSTGEASEMHLSGSSSNSRPESPPAAESSK